jgi:hypothetical protein
MQKVLKRSGILAFATLCASLVMPVSVSATEYTYTYTGNSFSYAGNSSPLMAYSEANRIAFSFTAEEVLAPLTTVSPTTWSFSDGTQTFNSEEGYNLNGFAITSANPSAENLFSDWMFHLDASSSCESCVVALNTSNSGAQVYDWAQNQLFNYGGNWTNPGTWSLSVSELPEPTSTLLLGFGLLGLAASRRKSAKK